MASKTSSPRPTMAPTMEVTTTQTGTGVGQTRNVFWVFFLIEMKKFKMHKIHRALVKLHGFKMLPQNAEKCPMMQYSPTSK